MRQAERREVGVYAGQICGAAKILAATETVRSDFLRGFLGKEQGLAAVRTTNLLGRVAGLGSCVNHQESNVYIRPLIAE